MGDRRGFIKQLGYLPLACSIFSSCSNPTNSNSDSSNSSGYSNQGNNSSSNNQTYIPNVNSNPETRINYNIQTLSTDSYGSSSFSKDGESFTAQCWCDNGNRWYVLEGLEAIFFQDKRFNKDFIFAIDPLGRAAPGIISTSSILKKESINLEDTHYVIMKSTDKISNFNNYIVDKMDSIDSWDTSNVDSIPGMVYAGEWSFNKLKYSNNLLKKASLGLILVPPASAAASEAYTFFSGTGEVLDKISGMIDLVNKYNPCFKINKNKEYPIYTPVGDVPLMILSDTISYVKNNSMDIQEAFPMKLGNSWTYSFSDGSDISYFLYTKNVGGKNVLAMTSNETYDYEQYFGMNGNSLTIYGDRFEDLGAIWLKPGAVVGDSVVAPGKTFHTRSNLYFEKDLGLTGYADNTYFYSTSQDITLPNGNSYGSCLKQRETLELTLNNGRETFKSSLSTDRWLAKNIGPVKISNEFGSSSLSEYRIANYHLGKFSGSSRKDIVRENFFRESIKRARR